APFLKSYFYNKLGLIFMPFASEGGNLDIWGPERFSAVASNTCPSARYPDEPKKRFVRLARCFLRVDLLFCERTGPKYSGGRGLCEMF
ncbi:MAG: hypothetical protein ACYTBS_12350, partial [Planctomycetota bacterium]